MVKATNSAYLNKKFKDLDFIAEDAKNELPEFEDGGETDEPVFGGTLEPVNIEAEAPDHIEDLKQAKKEYRKNNQDVGNVYLKRFEPQRQQTLEDLDKERMQQYAYNKAAQGIMNRNEYKGDADEYMQNLSPTRRKILKESSVWDKRSKSYPAMIEQAIVGGASGMGGPNFKNPNYTQQEAKESIAPLQLIEGVGGYAAKPLQGLSNKLGITDFENAKGNRYNIEQALRGKKNDASAITDMATDLTNLAGAGVGKQFTKLVDNGSIKAASRLIDDVVNGKIGDEVRDKIYKAEINSKAIKNRATKGKTKAIKDNVNAVKDGEEWLRRWMKHPTTKKKYRAGNEDIISEKGSDVVVQRRPESTLKSKANIKPIGKPKKGLELDFSDPYLQGFAVKDPKTNYRTFVKANLQRNPEAVKSTSIHEGAHQMQFDRVQPNMSESTKNNLDFIEEYLLYNKKLNPERFSEEELKALTGSLRKPENEYEKYLADPDEIHARIMELRHKAGLSPDDKATPETVEKLKDVSEPMYNMVEDKQKFADVMNKIWSGAGAGAATKAIEESESNSSKKYGGTIDNELDLIAEEVKQEIV